MIACCLKSLDDLNQSPEYRKKLTERGSKGMASHFWREKTLRRPGGLAGLAAAMAVLILSVPGLAQEKPKGPPPPLVAVAEVKAGGEPGGGARIHPHPPAADIHDRAHQRLRTSRSGLPIIQVA